jgi:hypothetical protein
MEKGRGGREGGGRKGRDGKGEGRGGSSTGNFSTPPLIFWLRPWHNLANFLQTSEQCSIVVPSPKSGPDCAPARVQLIHMAGLKLECSNVFGRTGVPMHTLGAPTHANKISL